MHVIKVCDAANGTIEETESDFARHSRPTERKVLEMRMAGQYLKKIIIMHQSNIIWITSLILKTISLPG